MSRSVDTSAEEAEAASILGVDVEDIRSLSQQDVDRFIEKEDLSMKKVALLRRVFRNSSDRKKEAQVERAPKRPRPETHGNIPMLSSEEVDDMLRAHNDRMGMEPHRHPQRLHLSMVHHNRVVGEPPVIPLQELGPVDNEDNLFGTLSYLTSLWLICDVVRPQVALNFEL